MRITLGTNGTRWHRSCLVICIRKLFWISSAPNAEFSDEQVRNVVTRSRANKHCSHWNISRARLRFLRKPSDDIVSSVFSSNHLDNASHQRDSSLTHWNVHSGSAGLAASLLRQRRLPGGYRLSQREDRLSHRGASLQK
jgi:hypothetical protein